MQTGIDLFFFCALFVGQNENEFNAIKFCIECTKPKFCKPQFEIQMINCFHFQWNKNYTEWYATILFEMRVWLVYHVFLSIGLNVVYGY